MNGRSQPLAYARGSEGASEPRPLGSGCTSYSLTALKLALAIFALGALPLQAGDIDVKRILKGVEDRYNHTQTLEVHFTEIHTFQGRKRTESGELFLRKPGRMRWQYSAPAGKLFVSDGKFVYSYLPDENQAEKAKFKETEDMRAPLAFLLGRLNFEGDFSEFRAQPDHENVLITATPKSDKMPYTEVTFLISPDFTIHWLGVKGQDGSMLEYVFENERKNPAIQDAMFRFKPPPGAEFIDSSRDSSQP
jgi:outer membrane lipoprotein carrier protein